MIIIHSNGHREIKKYDRVGHDYISHDPNTPPWYIEKIGKTARRYIIRPKGYNHDGEVIVVEEKNLLFVKSKFD